MKTISANRYRRLLALRKVAEQHADTIAMDPLLANAFARLETLILEIEAQMTLQSLKVESSTRRKGSARQALADELGRVLALCHEAATERGVVELEPYGSMLYADYYDTSEPKLLHLSEQVALQLDAHATTFDALSYTIYDVISFRDLIAAFREEISSPRAAIVERGSAIQSTDSTLSEAYKLLRFRLRRLMRPHSTKNPHFHQAFIKAMRVIPFGTRHKEDSSDSAAAA